MKNWVKQISKLGACREALEWGEQFETPVEAWQKCERGDWMLWLLGKLSGLPASDSRKKLVLAACQCARLALPYVTAGELRPLKAIETAEAWARGKAGVTLQMVRTAAAYDAAAYAAYAAYDAPAYAAYAAAAYAAYAAYDAPAYAAYAAAYAAAAYAARLSTLQKCADFVREHYPVAPDLDDYESL